MCNLLWTPSLKTKARITGLTSKINKICSNIWSNIRQNLSLYRANTILLPDLPFHCSNPWPPSSESVWLPLHHLAFQSCCHPPASHCSNTWPPSSESGWLPLHHLAFQSCCHSPASHCSSQLQLLASHNHLSVWPLLTWCLCEITWNTSYWLSFYQSYMRVWSGRPAWYRVPTINPAIDLSSWQTTPVSRWHWCCFIPILRVFNW
jgi:hypothetical protein